MSTLAFPVPIASAAAVFCGRHGDVSHLARRRGACRQTLYREAHAVAQAVAPAHEAPALTSLRQEITRLRTAVAHLQQQLRHAVVLEADQQAQFASTAQALGVSLSAARTLLGLLLGNATPSVARLGRLTQQAGRRAGAVLAVLDEQARSRARQIAADEIFVGRRPVLMTVEQDSLCWLGGRLTERRDGDEWAQEFAQLPAAEQVTRDGGQGLERGLKMANALRHAQGRSAIADQEDHFHILHRARRALAEVRSKAVRALHKADKAQARLQRDRRRHKVPGVRGAWVAKWWQQAEAAFDRWSAQEKALERLRVGLRLLTADGQLNTATRAEAEVRAALADLTGPEWSRLRTRLVGHKAFTFLTRVGEQLEALPVAVELREAAVSVEGLRRQPEALRGDGVAAGVLRGVLLACGLVLSLSGAAGTRALSLVRGVLSDAWRSSSLVEGVNSVLRMQQRRQKRMTPGLLDLKRLYWNVHVFVAGRRKGQSPYGRLGVKLPPGDWWQLLKMTPEQLRQQLSALETTA
jgi:predicted metal-dependent hydrolase